ncbi:MAG TPA: N-acetylmuramoyl-L-alanine amidase [Myxococcaceae bacterium]|nr:N-acetylmuramoyl-L-alanine amidase [Myxococcaceae bacterium]
MSAAAALVLLLASAEPRVVIDPGHGGKADGAIGPGGYKEKDFSLELAQKLAASLEKAGAKVMLTRDKDATVALPERVAAANKFHPDLLISLHANSMPTRKMRAQNRGIETFFLSLSASGEDARHTADRENSEGVVAAGAGAAAQPSGDDPLSFILADLKRSEAHAGASRLAYAVHQKLIAQTRAEDRGVQQAPLFVLTVDCPAVLLELGFLSHPEESAKLKDGEYQDTLVAAISEAVKGYLADTRKQDVRAHRE